MTQWCALCDRSRDYLISYDLKDGLGVPATGFCSKHAAEIHRTISPLTSDGVRSFIQTTAGKTEKDLSELTSRIN